MYHLTLFLTTQHNFVEFNAIQLHSITGIPTFAQTAPQIHSIIPNHNHAKLAPQVAPHVITTKLLIPQTAINVKLVLFLTIIICCANLVATQLLSMIGI